MRFYHWVQEQEYKWVDNDFPFKGAEALRFKIFPQLATECILNKLQKNIEIFNTSYCVLFQDLIFFKWNTITNPLTDRMC